LQRKEVYPVSTNVLEEFMTDTTTDVDRSQETRISAEYLAQLRELAESQGWSLDGTLRRALAVTRTAPSGQDGKMYIYREGKRYSLSLRWTSVSRSLTRRIISGFV
jgi:hypothetical protein